MKVNEYFLLSDILQLSDRELESFRAYLSLMGVEFTHTKDILLAWYPGGADALSVWDRNGERSPFLVFTRANDEDLTTQYTICDIKRMAGLGSSCHEDR